MAAIRTYVPRPPSQRAWTPKATDPGQRIAWTRTIGYATTVTRTGTIWSAGALPSSAWVQPGDSPAGDMVLVMLRSMTEHPAYPATWQHDTVRRCENLRRSKGLFAEYRTELARSWGYGPAREEEHVVAFHADRDCLEVRHATRDCTEWEPTVGYVIRMLLSATARGRSDLCRTCIYLSAPGMTELGEAV